MDMKTKTSELSQGKAIRDAEFLAPLLDTIAEQAATADSTRSISPDVISALKSNAVLKMAASKEINGLDSSLVNIANELGALAPCCTSTAWVLWNHLCLFHHFCGLLGPTHQKFLSSITTNGEMVSQGVGPDTRVKGIRKDEHMIIDGVTAFATGCRYGDWTGAGFFEKGQKGLQFVLLDLRHPNIRIDPTWQAMSVRASATDHVYFEQVEVPVAHVASWPVRDRETFRDPNHRVINQRYREDWTALAAMFMGVMASRLAGSCLEEIATESRERRAIFGVQWAERPLVQVNLGRARALINAAADTAYAALQESDDRIAAKVNPTEECFLRQVLAGMQAIQLCDEAMKLLQRIMGGNGLRESTNFERRFRDFQAMPLHIISHVDRITEQSGKNALGLETDNPF